MRQLHCDIRNFVYQGSKKNVKNKDPLQIFCNKTVQGVEYEKNHPGQSSGKAVRRTAATMGLRIVRMT